MSLTDQKPSEASSNKKSHQRLTIKLVAAAIAMFGFALFVLPPMYDVLCDITGLNGKVSQSGRQRIDSLSETTTTHSIHIQFIANTNSDAPWPFSPNERSMTAKPGKIYQTSFRIENPNGRDVIAQAIPSVSPAVANQYLKKTQCFCFEQQPLKPYEGKDMGLIFYIDPEIPKSIKTMTLSYQLYDISDKLDGKADSAQNIIETDYLSKSE